MDETKRAEEFVKKDNEIVKGIDRLLDSVKEQMSKIKNREAYQIQLRAWEKLLTAREMIGSAETIEFKGMDLSPYRDDGDGDAVNATVEEVDASVKTANVGYTGKVTGE